jgi:hypothetical protein
MSFKLSQEQFWQGVRNEEEADCDIGAGYDGIHLEKMMTDSMYFEQMRRLQSIVLQEFNDLLQGWHLGIGTESAISYGRQLVLERLQSPSSEVQQQLWSVLAEDETLKGVEQPQPQRAEVKTILLQVLTATDWEAIAQVAGNSVQAQVLSQIQVA